MKVMLVNPPWKLDQESVYSQTGAIYPPLGLASMAAVLEREEPGRVEILDAWGLGLGMEKFRDRIEASRPEIIGITAYTTTIVEALEAAKIVRQSLPGSVVVMGGPHPSIHPDEVIAFSQVDYLIRGEGEYSFAALVKKLSTEEGDLGEIPGLTRRVEGKIVHHPDPGFVPDLTALPPPDRSKLPMAIYRPASGAYRRTPVTSMITSRGCPFNCTFCSKAIFGSAVRFRTPVQVLAEAEDLIERYQIREIYFADDCFTLDRERTAEICRLFLDRALDLTWTCSTRANLVDRELLGLMKRAGCVSIGYGIETGSPETAHKIKKGITFEQAREAIALTRAAGIESRGSYIFGFPGETQVNLEETLRAALALNADFVIFNLAIPLPGTELYREAREKGLLLADGFEMYPLTDGAHVLIRPEGITPEELKNFYNRAYRTYYLRPRYLFQRLKSLKSWEDLRLNWRGVRDFFNWRRGTK
ncbi:MAG: radical SAM protein [Candidatus Erginobacter occultus]|nr:radical SAM protein [Candidatus Erginobacter occultus]